MPDQIAPTGARNTHVRLQLIDDWRRWYRFYCVHALLICTAIGALITALSAAHVRIPGWLLGPLLVIAAVSGIVGRVVKQDPADVQRIEELEKK